MKMENDNVITKNSFDRLCRTKLGNRDTNRRHAGDLFEIDWEVFVAKYDTNTGSYSSRTYCCEEAIG